MSKPEFDPTDLDDTSVFDFLDEDSAVAGDENRVQAPVRQPTRGKIKMPLIREPVPVSISGALGTAAGRVANVGSDQQVEGIRQTDSDFDFLNDVVSKPAKSEMPRSNEYDPYARFDRSSRDLAFAEDMRKVHQVDAEPEDLPALVRYGLLTLSILVLGGIGFLVHTYVLTPSTQTVAVGAGNQSTSPDESSADAVIGTVDQPIVDDAEIVADLGGAQGLYAKFKSELSSLEVMVANGDLDAATIKIKSMDRTLYGYGEPEFVELLTRIDFLRRDGVVDNNVSINVNERLDTAPVAQGQADAAAERAAAEQAATAESERLAAIQEARAEAARMVAEQAAKDDELRVAAEQAALAEARRVAAVKAAKVAEEEAARLAARQAAEQLAAVEAAQAEAARVEAERLAVEQAARVEAERLAVEQAARVEAQREAAEKAAIAARALQNERAAQAEIEAERRNAEIAARRVAERDAAARVAAERLNAEREANRKASEDEAKNEAARAAARRRAERLAAQQRASEIEAADAAATATAISQQSTQLARAEVEDRPATALSVQPRPITDDDLQQVYRRFSNLESAIEERDITRVISLTKPSGARVQQFLQIFENSQSLNAQIVNVSTRSNNATISGTLKILNITRTDGSVVQPPSSVSSIALTSSRTGGQWSVIEW